MLESSRLWGATQSLLLKGSRKVKVGCLLFAWKEEWSARQIGRILLAAPRSLNGDYIYLGSKASKQQQQRRIFIAASKRWGKSGTLRLHSYYTYMEKERRELLSSVTPPPHHHARNL